MAGYNSASRSYVAVADADGVMRDLSPWVERIGPLGRAVLGLDTTGLNDAAGRTTAGSEATQEFTIAGRWDDASGIGPDAVLAASWVMASTCSTAPRGMRRVNAASPAGSCVCPIG